MRLLKTLLKLKSKIALKILKYSILLVLFTLLSHYTKIFYERGFYEYYGDAVVKLYLPNEGSGTGFNIRYKGKSYILTNKHVCNIGIRTGQMFSIGNTGISVHNIVKKDDKHDLCVLTGLPRSNYISLASFYNFREKIFIIGHPRGDALTLESGRIIGTKIAKLIDQDTKECDESKKICDFFGRQFCTKKLRALQSNAIIFPGNSGSPVLNKWGNLVGVVFAGSRGIERMSLIVPLENIKAFLNTL